jgi:hypothetical protein
MDTQLSDVATAPIIQFLVHRSCSRLAMRDWLANVAGGITIIYKPFIKAII